MRGLALSTLGLLVASAAGAAGVITTSSSSIESNGQQESHSSLRHDHSNQQRQQRELLQLPNNKTGCEAIHADELPAECACRDPGPYSIVIECLKEFESPHWNDTIGMKIDIDPCNSLGSSISLDITEFNHNIEYPIAGIRAGENKNIPIPGCAIIIPGIGNVGLDAAVAIYGNPDQLTMKIGLNACFGVSPKKVIRFVMQDGSSCVFKKCCVFFSR